MKLSLNWLNDYVSTNGITPKELADKLLNIGFEVEEIIDTGKGLENIVTGKILEIKKHPDADKLHICSVDVGKETLTIVTGAKNINAGDIVPVACDGAVLPNNKVIKSAPLRGVMSYGMMCSGKELGVDNSVIEGAEVDGILILPHNTKVGRDIKEVLRFNDVIFDISVTANRPDCQSVYGMAREVAALLGRKLKPLDLKYDSMPCEKSPTIKIADKACGKYTCRIIKDVKIKQSPQWMRDRLRSVGIRPINNVVDITNYVLTEVGQPLHAFDLSFVSENGVIVRKAQNGEKITALNCEEYTLSNDMLVISDKVKPLAIAGIMGGEFSGINNKTDCVLLESAKFAKGVIRAASRKLGLRSDSSARYEKGVDSWSVDIGRERALALFDRLKAGKVTDGFAEASDGKESTKVIKVTAGKISALLGIKIKQDKIIKILQSLDFSVEPRGGELIIEVPPFREDIDNYTDICEEIIRFYGYDNIDSAFMPTAKITAGGRDIRLTNISVLKSLITACGAYEISTFSFIGKRACDKLHVDSNSVLRRHIEILNPLGEEYSVMRTQMASGMLSAAAYNISKKNKNFRLFEVGKVYIPKELPITELPVEKDALCMAFAGEKEDFYTVKSVVSEIFRKYGICPQKTEYSQVEYYHPGISADYDYNDKRICTFGKIHPLVAKDFDLPQNIYLCEMDISLFISHEVPQIKFEPLSKYQTVERDLAVIVKEDVPVGEVLRALKNADKLCVNAELFDIYKGEQIERGYKSVALSFELSAKDRTLNDEEITGAVNNILNALETEFGAKLRY